jgi:hypothetical protein
MVSSRAQDFANLAAITSYLIVASRDDPLQTMAVASPPPQPP